MDDAGRALHFAKPVRRIVSLAPDITENLYAAGAGPFVVGVIKGSDFPEEAKQLPVVGNYQSLNDEAILELHPDLVITWGKLNLKHLESLGLKVFVSEHHKLLDIPKTLQRFGCLANTEEIADAAANKFLKKLSLLTRHVKQRANVFYQVWDRPLITVNKDSWINEIIILCGGKNIFSQLHSVAPVVSLEGVIEANPDVIMSSQQLNALHGFWDKWTGVRAVSLQKIFSVNPDLIERASPRLLEGAAIICQDLSKPQS